GGRGGGFAGTGPRSRAHRRGSLPGRGGQVLSGRVTKGRESCSAGQSKRGPGQGGTGRIMPLRSGSGGAVEQGSRGENVAAPIHLPRFSPSIAAPSRASTPPAPANFSTVSGRRRRQFG